MSALTSNELSPAAPERGLRAMWALVRDVAMGYSEDRAPSMGAALAYYTLFSVAPLLLIVIAVAGAVFGPEAARGEIFAQLRGLLGADGASAVEGLLNSVHRQGQSGWGTAVGAVLLLVGATTVFAELQDALDRVWRTATPRRAGFLNVLRARLVSFGLIVGVGFLLIVSLVMSAALAVLSRWWAPLFGGWPQLLQGADALVSFGLMLVLFAAIFKIVPSARIAWHDVWIGSAVTAVLFTIGKVLIGLYIGTSGVTSGFGAAGSLVALLVWVYWSSQVFLIGAEFTWAYAHRFGSRRPAVPAPCEAPSPAANAKRAANAVAAEQAKTA
jgi:membrane protein